VAFKIRQNAFPDEIRPDSAAAAHHDAPLDLL